jgi:CheY-like chemotaxis protein
VTDLSALRGRIVLLVEDESLVSLLAEDVLDEAGCTVLLAMRLPEALELASSADVHLAILDVNLGGETSYPVAETLAHRDIPFVFATGYGAAGMREEYQHHRVIQKPYAPQELLCHAARAIADASARRSIARPS